VYLLEKFRLHILITYRVAALQSSHNRTINLYNEYRLQALTKMVVTYKQIEVQSYNFCHCTHHEQGNRLMGKFFLYSSFFTTFEGKFMKKNQSQAIISTWRKQVPITYISLGLLQRNTDFQTTLEQANKMMSRFILLGPSFTKKKNVQNFFNNSQVCTHCIQCFIL